MSELPALADVAGVMAVLHHGPRAVTRGATRSPGVPAGLVFVDVDDELARDAVVWVSAFGRWRRGVVVKVARLRVTVAYVTPASPAEIRVVAVRRDLVAVQGVTS